MPLHREHPSEDVATVESKGAARVAGCGGRQKLADSGHVCSLSGQCSASKMAAAEESSTGVQLRLAAIDVVIGGSL